MPAVANPLSPVSANEAPTARRPSASGVSVLKQALVVALVAFGLALLANQLSPRGIALTRDYFPTVGATTVGAPDPAAAATSPAAALGDALVPGLESDGVKSADAKSAVLFFNDARREMGLIIFVDARADQSYAEGHIPGAWQLDRFYPEKYLPDLLLACAVAETVVVYCNGGECEDSVFATRLLLGAGVPAGRLRVFMGGLKEWSALGQPVESGARNSGVLKGGKP